MLLGNVILTRCDLTEIRDPVFKARATIILNQKIGRKIMCEAEEKWANELFSDGLIEGRIEGHRDGIVDLTKRQYMGSARRQMRDMCRGDDDRHLQIVFF